MSAKNISFLTSLSVFTQVIDGTVEPCRIAPVNEVVALLAQELNRPGITLHQLKNIKVYWFFKNIDFYLRDATHTILVFRGKTKKEKKEEKKSKKGEKLRGWTIVFFLQV